MIILFSLSLLFLFTGTNFIFIILLSSNPRIIKFSIFNFLFPKFISSIYQIYFARFLFFSKKYRYNQLFTQSICFSVYYIIGISLCIVSYLSSNALTLLSFFYFCIPYLIMVMSFIHFVFSLKEYLAKFSELVMFSFFIQHAIYGCIALVPTFIFFRILLNNQIYVLFLPLWMCVVVFFSFVVSIIVQIFLFVFIRYWYQCLSMTV
jgi:hypothetical protein